jgi:hypothetical protein
MVLSASLGLDARSVDCWDIMGGLSILHVLQADGEARHGLGDFID